MKKFIDRSVRDRSFISFAVAISVFSLCYSIFTPFCNSFLDPVVSFYGDAYEINLKGNVINSLDCDLRQIELDEAYLRNETPIYMVYADTKLFIDRHNLCIEYKKGNNLGMSLLDFDSAASISYGGQYRKSKNIIFSDNIITVNDSVGVEFVNSENDHTVYYMRPEFNINNSTNDIFDALITAKKIGVNQTEHENDDYIITVLGTEQFKNFDFYLISADENSDMCFELNTKSKYSVNVGNRLDFEGQADMSYFVTGKNSTLTIVTDNNPREFNIPYMILQFHMKKFKRNKLGNSIVDINFSNGIENDSLDMYLDYNRIYNCIYSSYVTDAYINDKTLTPNGIENILYNTEAIVLSFVTTIITGIANRAVKNKL